MKELSLRNQSIILKNATAEGKFTLDPHKLSASHVQGAVFGGRFTAEGEVSDWQEPPTPPKRSNKEQSGALKLKLNDLMLAELLASLGPQFRPVNQLKFAGNLSGTSEVRWKRSIRDAEITAALEVKKPDRVRQGEIPLVASFQGSYAMRPAHLQIANFSANTPATQLHASGVLSSASDKFSFFDGWRVAASARPGFPAQSR